MESSNCKYEAEVRFLRFEGEYAVFYGRPFVLEAREGACGFEFLYPFKPEDEELMVPKSNIWYSPLTTEGLYRIGKKSLVDNWKFLFPYMGG